MPALYEITPAGLNFRTAPDPNSEVIAVLEKGDIVEKIAPSASEKWWQCRTVIAGSEETGFLHHGYLKEIDPEIPKKNSWWFFPDLKATYERMKLFAGEAAAKTYSPAQIPEFRAVLKSYGIMSNTKRFTHFLAQLAHESALFLRLEENLNYSGSALWGMFRKYFKSEEEAQSFHRKREQIANRIYANRMGNGDEASGDGWRYRGRGFIQLTGRENYRSIGALLNEDLEGNPDRVRDEPLLALKVACEYWKSRDLNRYADADDIEQITKRINGGYNGLKHRKELLEQAKKLWG